MSDPRKTIEIDIPKSAEERTRRQQFKILAREIAVDSIVTDAITRLIEQVIEEVSNQKQDEITSSRAEVGRLTREMAMLQRFKWNDEQIRLADVRADSADRKLAMAVEVIDEYKRAIGDHYAPNDCYATGPVTGDPIRDLVECPACSALAKHEKLLTELEKADG